jgi:hypothetical protein
MYSRKQHTKGKGVLHNAAYKMQDVLHNAAYKRQDVLHNAAYKRQYVFCNAEQKIPSDVLCSLFGFSSALHNQDMVYMDMHGFE